MVTGTDRGINIETHLLPDWTTTPRPIQEEDSVRDITAPALDLVCDIVFERAPRAAQVLLRVLREDVVPGVHGPE